MRAGQSLALDNRAYNTLHRATRCRGERGFALLTGRWRALQRVTISPRRIGELAQAALVLTRIENVQLRQAQEEPGRRGPLGASDRPNVIRSTSAATAAST